MQVIFDISQDLITDQMSCKKVYNIIVTCGGIFTVSYCFCRYFAYLWMPWFTYLSVIVRLFKVDPSKGKMPRDPTSVDKTEQADLVQQCKARVKTRIPLT